MIVAWIVIDVDNYSGQSKWLCKSHLEIPFLFK